MSASGTNKPAWLAEAERDYRGGVKSNFTNAVLAIHNDPAISTCFAFNEMSRTAMLVRPIPGRRRHAGGNQSDPAPDDLRDIDASKVQDYLQRSGLPDISIDCVFRAIEVRADECRFHPVRDYLDGLKWDGVARAGAWLSKYLGAAATPYANAIGQMFLIAMVARIFKPGCKADYMLVLEGAQGSLKSTACRILAGEYLSDAMPNLRVGKDVSHHVRGKWLIEVPEMSSMSGLDDALLKAFITRQDEMFRPSHGRRDVKEPRQCLFVGTTNKAMYLTDDTGGRRYWPVAAGEIDAEALAKDRDQLFAEAVALYLQGAKWWPDAAFEARHIKPQQEARREVDDWQESIAEYAAGKRTVTPKEVARGAGVTTGDAFGTRDRNRVTAILKLLGYERGEKDGNGNIPWQNKEIAENSHHLRLVS
jgi:predicted P-loop ATPase